MLMHFCLNSPAYLQLQQVDGDAHVTQAKLMHRLSNATETGKREQVK